MNDDLYQRAIVDLARRGRRFARLESPDRSATIDNPLCGDRITLDLEVEGPRVVRVGHRTRGCLLCEAAVTLIAEAAPDRDMADLEASGRDVVAMIGNEDASLRDLWPGLETLAPVRRHKSRQDCVTLPFQALVAALQATV